MDPHFHSKISAENNKSTIHTAQLVLEQKLHNPSAASIQLGIKIPTLAQQMKSKKVNLAVNIFILRILDQSQIYFQYLYHWAKLTL